MSTLGHIYLQVYDNDKRVKQTLLLEEILIYYLTLKHKNNGIQVSTSFNCQNFFLLEIQLDCLYTQFFVCVAVLFNASDLFQVVEE